MSKLMTEYLRNRGSKRYIHVYKDGEVVSKKKSNDKGGHKVGILVAVPAEHSNKVYVGWSKCNMGVDKFDRGEGLKVAIERATSLETDPIAQSMVKKMRHFIDRVRRCYKDREIVMSFSFPEKVVVVNAKAVE